MSKKPNTPKKKIFGIFPLIDKSSEEKIDGDINDLEEKYKEPKGENNSVQKQNFWEKLQHDTQSTIESWQLQAKKNQERNREQRLKRQKQRKENQTKFNVNVEKFFQKQQEDFENFINGLKKNAQKQQEIAKQKQEYKKKITQIKKQIHNDLTAEQKIKFDQDKKEYENLVKEKKELQNQIRREKRNNFQNWKELKKQKQKNFQEESTEIRKKDWERFLHRQRRRTKRFFKFSNRVWWKSYLSVIGWVFLVLAFLLGIYFGLNAIGINLLEIIPKLINSTGN